MPLCLPVELSTILEVFAVLFTQPSWAKVPWLVVGALLCHGPRRITAVLRVMGLSQEKRFEKYHRLLNRAQWNSLAAAKILLGLLLPLLPPDYPLLMPMDDTIERRQGKRIKAKGCYRDACRSTKSKVVTCFGLKWVCLMLIVPLPWNTRPWALPVMTVLAPSREANEARGRPHKTTVDWAIVLVRVMSRWLKRPWVLIGDGGFACVQLGWQCAKRQVTLISRLRLDAALYGYPTPPKAGQAGRPREKGPRAASLAQLAKDTSQPWREAEVNWYGNQRKTVRLLSGVHLWYTHGEKPLPVRWVLVTDPDGQADPEAFFSTDVDVTPEHIISWFVLRWAIEVTFEEARAHLGVETQRQWSDKAIARTTPVLFGLFSLTCLFAHALRQARPLPVLSTAWYDKKGQATFSDLLAFVRRAIWACRYFGDSEFSAESIKMERPLWESLLDQLAFAT